MLPLIQNPKSKIQNRKGCLAAEVRCTFPAAHLTPSSQAVPDLRFAPTVVEAYPKSQRSRQREAVSSGPMPRQISDQDEV